MPRELRRLERILPDGEQLISLAQGRFEDGIGLLAATDRRLIFLGRQLVIEERTFRAQGIEFPYSDISVEATERALSGQLVVHQGRKRLPITEITPKERATEIADYVAGRVAEERKAARAAKKRRVPSPALVQK